MTLENLFAILACCAVLGLVAVVVLNSEGWVNALFSLLLVLGILALMVFTVFTVVTG